RYVNLGRSAYLAATALVIGISAFFMWLILDNHFEVQYIAMNSSTDLPLYYKISVFWTGQQGSFLFWAFVSGIVGLFVMRRAREFEPGLMAFWGTVQSLLIVLLLIDSPFMLLPEETRMQVMDGIGLRELLQNPWMVVHPPVTFLGYTAMCVPAAFAIAALLKGDFSKWAKATLPWAVFGWLTLGAGIILGAYWSYGVLGWGGYWAWDPVENASLVPWLTGTALLHGLIAERYRGSFSRANIVLALLTFLFVFYSTFLTRSSVLADASVHTFGDSKAGVPLLVFMSVFLAFSAISLIAGWRKMASIPSYTVMKSKDFMFFLGVIALVGSAAFVLIGTSAPIIGKALPASVVERISPAPQIEQMAQTADGETEKKPTIQVDQSFYNKTNAPVAAIAVLLMALAPVAAWRREKTEKAEIIPALLVGIGIAAVGFVAFKLHITYIALELGLVSIPALLLNLYSLVRMRKSGIRALGGFITHIGMAVFFLGVVLSANQSKTIPVNLPEGEPQTVELSSFGKPIAMREYKFTYEGTEPINERKTALKIKVEHDGKVDHAVVSMPSKPEYQREVPGVPYIISSFTKDLYIAPKFLPTTIEGLVDKGEPVPISDFKLTFTDFVLPEDFNSS
ncbi:MAG TPA: cytochrome c biogenesis protein CcsA, partial [Armatimonadota bacterium]|nr:cytochrome c biogenesis protein CcsA [Armatimonadota bacterium]